MHRVNRRNLLASLGTLSGSALLTGYGMQFAAEQRVQADEVGSRLDFQMRPDPAWNYIKLDPESVGETAYRMYPEGGCMYGVVGSVIGALSNQLGEPFRSFPVEMMRYGSGGVGSWGSLCGVVNGASALIGLFHREKSKEAREEMIAEFCLWYETTPLPTYEPAESQPADEADPSIAGSVLCHISTAKWCQLNGYDAFSAERKQRCQRLTADGAMKIVEILNRRAEDPACEFATLTPDVKSCVDCHGKKELADASGKMNCGSCHQFDKKHP